MYWPRLKLTDSERDKWSLYSEPKKHQRNVLYRAYAAELELTTTTTEDVENIQIARRSRIFALTVSGDVHNIEIQMYDSSGEQYIMGFIPLTNLFMGLNVDPRGMPGWNSESPFFYDDTLPRLPLGAVNGHTFAIAPHVIEPNIVLAPNQTLSIKARALNPPQTLTLFNPLNVNEMPVEEKVFLSMVVHVWEFPIE